MRGVKAEGGWAVVCTEQVEFHHTADINPFVELRLWDDRDIPMLARMADRIHEFGSLAGIELAYNGMNSPELRMTAAKCRWGRQPCRCADLHLAIRYRARAMDKARHPGRFVSWQVRGGAARPRRAGFDLVYVYAGHSTDLTCSSSCRVGTNTARPTSMAGSLENRTSVLLQAR